MDYIIGGIIAFITFWIYEFGLFNIFESVAEGIKRLRGGKQLIIPIVVWVIILSSAFTIMLMWLNDYIVDFIIAVCVAFIVALCGILNEKKGRIIFAVALVIGGVLTLIFNPEQFGIHKINQDINLEFDDINFTVTIPANWKKAEAEDTQFDAVYVLDSTAMIGFTYTPTEFMPDHDYAMKYCDDFYQNLIDNGDIKNFKVDENFKSDAGDGALFTYEDDETLWEHYLYIDDKGVLQVTFAVSIENENDENKQYALEVGKEIIQSIDK